MSPTVIRAGETVLVLNHVGEALSFTNWLRAVGMVSCGRAMPLEQSQRVIRSQEGEWEMTVPLVVMLRGGKYVRPYHRVRLSRRSLFVRDGHECQYCGMRGEASQLTMDHVVPRSRGGATTWENVVTACRPCNHKKGNRSPQEAGLKMKTRPVPPTNFMQLHNRTIATRLDPAHEVWLRYLPVSRRRH